MTPPTYTLGGLHQQSNPFQVSVNEDLLLEHATLVKKIALHIKARLPDSVQTDDLIQAGMIGLLAAVKSFDASKGAKFETYAGIRIRGAILDEVRTSDWTPRSVSKNIRETALAIRRVESRTQKKATDREIAAEMELSLEEYYKISRDAAGAQLLSTEEITDDDGVPFLNAPSTELEPPQQFQNDNLRDRVIQSIDQLPEKERLVMSMYYDDEMNLKEIGAVLGVSESRVSQIHGQALARIRAKIEEELN
jgi:RNA polymerase sigma factor for flagellar operon FliA